MIEYHTLENISLKVIYEAFMEVFSDYQIKFNMSYDDFEATLIKKGYNKYVSVGAFYNHRLIGFILNGLRIWNNQLTIYDVGTGVIPKMRGQGITSQMFNEVKQNIINENIKQYLLEVIQTNENALHLYLKKGFQIQRELKCYQIKKDEYQLIQKHEVKHIDDIHINDLQSFWNCQPSWQNSIESIFALKSDYCFSVVYQHNQIVGYGVIDQCNGNICQIAVDPQYRNQGIGRSLLSDLIQRTKNSTIKVLNVEDKITQQFLDHCHFENYTNQYEMILQL